VSRFERHGACSISDVGIACALGCSVDEVWPRLRAGDTSRITQRADSARGPARPYGAVLGELPALAGRFADLSCRNNQLALLAFEQIEKSVAATHKRVGPQRLGIVVGTSTSGISEAESAFRARSRSGRLGAGFGFGQLEHGGLAEFLARVSGALGPAYTISTACSSGAKALASARSLLDLDLCDAVLAGAVDSSCDLTALGFAALQAVSARLTNPMSRNRDGITLGEGGALFLVTRERGGIQLLGTGESSDGHHMSAPEPGGQGFELCMRSALADAALEPRDIAYVNLHGTGTPQNDKVESAAVERVFGRGIPCSSTKPLVGHTLGASGALEAAFCWMILSRREGERLLLPPHRWDGCPDPELAALSLADSGASASVAGPAAVVSNSFGFGGSNCALVLGEERG
jgi:3-oxoacyl-[acyl-carrier-protein] synthase-1